MAHEPTKADLQIYDCIQEKKSFVVIAGAGSGKTTSLISALEYIRTNFGGKLLRDGQNVACITYTNRACDVIIKRLGNDDSLFDVSTIHSFLWSQISRYTDDIREILIAEIISKKIKKYQEKIKKGKLKNEIKVLKQIDDLNDAIEFLPNIEEFSYDKNQFSDFSKGKIGHADVIEIATQLILLKPFLCLLIGQQFPYIFVDEAQDTFKNVVDAFNKICKTEGFPIVGYFGDPMQQIYSTGVGNFYGPQDFITINKEENYRSPPVIINLANKLRHDIQQHPAQINAEKKGSLSITLITAEKPLETKNRYSDKQLDNALTQFDIAVNQIGWQDNKKSKCLFLVHKMIARRLGFLKLRELFTSKYASSRAQDEFDSGDHFLLKVFKDLLCPLIQAANANDNLHILNVLVKSSPAFAINDENRNCSLNEMLNIASSNILELTEIWNSGSVREVLEFVKLKNLWKFSDQLKYHLMREKRTEEFDSELHSSEKSDWLADEFFTMSTKGFIEYVDFITNKTTFSTHHGVKGEQYDNVLVVFDDNEAAWSKYSFTKFLTLDVVSAGNKELIERTQKLCYVCFTRARINLHIIFFCLDPKFAKTKLLSKGYFTEEQIKFLNS